MSGGSSLTVPLIAINSDSGGGAGNETKFSTYSSAAAFSNAINEKPFTRLTSAERDHILRTNLPRAYLFLLRLVGVWQPGVGREFDALSSSSYQSLASPYASSQSPLSALRAWFERAWAGFGWLNLWLHVSSGIASMLYADVFRRTFTHGTAFFGSCGLTAVIWTALYAQRQLFRRVTALDRFCHLLLQTPTHKRRFPLDTVITLCVVSCFGIMILGGWSGLYSYFNSTETTFLLGDVHSGAVVLKGIVATYLIGLMSPWWFSAFTSIFITFLIYALLHVELVEQYINYLGPLPYGYDRIGGVGQDLIVDEQMYETGAAVTSTVTGATSAPSSPAPGTRSGDSLLAAPQPTATADGTALARSPVRLTALPSLYDAIGRHQLLSAHLAYFELSMDLWLVWFISLIVVILFLTVLFGFPGLQHILPLLCSEVVFPFAFVFLPAALVTSRCDDVIAHVNSIEAQLGGWTVRSRQPIPPHIVAAADTELQTATPPAGGTTAITLSTLPYPPGSAPDNWATPNNLNRFLQYLTYKDLGFRILKVKLSPSFVKSLGAAVLSLFALAWANRVSN